MIQQVDKHTQIGDVAKKLRITTRTIRYYEEKGLVEASKRRSGPRSYSQRDIARLRFILKLKDLNLSLHEIQEMAAYYDVNTREESMPQILDILDGHLKNVDLKISRLASLRNDLVAYQAKVMSVLESEAA